MFCPQCRMEYREGSVECPDCRVRLVAELADAGDSGPGLMEVFEPKLAFGPIAFPSCRFLVPPEHDREARELPAQMESGG